MDKVIGLGDVGCGVAEEFTAYPEYRVYKFGMDLPSRGNFLVDPQKDISSYEENIEPDDIYGYLRSIKDEDEVLFVVAGGEPIGGMSLGILEQIKDSSITVLYITPDEDVCTAEQKTNHKILYNVFQEYARSGVFRRLLLMSRAVLEDLVGDVPVRVLLCCSQRVQCDHNN